MTDFCGLGPFRPHCLLKLANVGWFTFFACFLLLVQGAYLGYIMGVVTTIEKRFKIPSYKSGALLSCYDFGLACALLLVGQLGSRSHKPRWIGIGALVNSLCCLGMTLPHFVFGPFNSNNALHHGSGSLEVDQVEHVELCITKNESLVGGTTMNNHDMKSDGLSAFVMLVAFQILCGVSSSTLSTFTFVYIDDNSSQKGSFLYLGLLSAMWGYGPAFGFGLAAYCTQVFVTLYGAPLFMTTSSVHWLGAWWLGFVILSTLYLLAAIPFFFYPKILKRKKVTESSLVKKTSNDVEAKPLTGIITAGGKRKLEKTSVFSHLAKIPEEIARLFKNKIFVFATGTSIFWAYVTGGYSAFLPKYIEVHFHQSSHVANIYGGLIAILGSATGCAVGGKLLSIFNPKMHNALSMMSMTMFAVLCFYLTFSFLDCPNKSITGMKDDFTWPAVQSNKSFYEICKHGCDCAINNFEPVCSGGEEFFSPCAAGCETVNVTGSYNRYESCSCSPSSTATSGFCSETCNGILLVYLVGTFLAGFAGSLFTVSWTMSLIKSVSPEQKSVSYALSNFLSSLLGFMPSAVLFGSVVDSTCLLWSETSETTGKQSNCLYYHNDWFRNRYHLLTSSFVFLSLICSILCARASRNFHFHK